MTDHTLSLGLSLDEAAAHQNAPARCSFCNLGEGEVARLFQGRRGFICDECITVCLELLADYRELGIEPVETGRSWFQRLFSEETRVSCSFTAHDEDNPQGERLFSGPAVQICDQCVRACAAFKGEDEVQAEA